MFVEAEFLTRPCCIVRLVDETAGPYPLKVVVVFDGLDSVIIKGVDKPITNTQGRALREWLRSMGVRLARYQRNGRWRTLHRRQTLHRRRPINPSH